MSKCKYTIKLSDGSLLEIPSDFDENNEDNLKKSIFNWLINSSEKQIDKIFEEEKLPIKYNNFIKSRAKLEDIVFPGNKFLDYIKNKFSESFLKENILFIQDYEKDFDYDQENDLVIINTKDINSDYFSENNFLKGILTKLLFDYNTSQQSNIQATDKQFIDYIGKRFGDKINSLFEQEQVKEEPKFYESSLEKEEISKETLSKINKKYNVSYTLEQFEALSKEEQNNILNCL